MNENTFKIDIKIFHYYYTTMATPVMIPEFIKNKNRKTNDKRNKKVFDKFIAQPKDFNDDIFGLIKSFMIEPVYKNSYRFIENKEIRLTPFEEPNWCLNKTTFYVGKRFGNLIQIKQTRYYDSDVVNPQYKMYKIKIGTQHKEDGTEVLYEYISMFNCCLREREIIQLDNEGSTIESDCIYNVYYTVCSDMYDTPLWNDDDEHRWRNIEYQQAMMNQDGSLIDDGDDYDDDETDEDEEEMTDEQVWTEHIEEIESMME